MDIYIYDAYLAYTYMNEEEEESNDELRNNLYILLVQVGDD